MKQLESTQDYIIDWEMTFDLYKKGLVKNPMMNHWIVDNIYTQTNFFKFGFVTFTINDSLDEIPYIRIIYIVEKFRNKKIGLAIISQILKYYTEKGYKFVSVEPTKESLNFWIKFGFVNNNKGKFIKTL